MDTRILFFASYEIFISLVFGFLTVFLTYRALDRFILNRKAEESLRNNNLSLAIFQGTVIFTVLLIVHTSVLPSVSTLKTVVANSGSIQLKAYAVSFLYFLMFYSMSLLLSLLVIFICVTVYVWATRDLQEMAEIKKGNVSVSLLLCFIILGQGIFLQNPIKNFIGSFVNYEIALDQKGPLKFAPKQN
jgi:uncharacterized membrane protein YjfL (UPF0719 family)